MCVYAKKVDFARGPVSSATSYSTGSKIVEKRLFFLFVFHVSCFKSGGSISADRAVAKAAVFVTLLTYLNKNLRIDNKTLPF